LRVQDRAVDSALFTRGQLLGFFATPHVHNVHVLFGMPGFWQLGVFRGIYNMASRNVKIIGPAEWLNRGTLKGEMIVES